MGGQPEGEDRVRTEASTAADGWADTDEGLLPREENQALTEEMGAILP